MTGPGATGRHGRLTVRGGFTLVELLSAMGVASILMLTLLSLAGQGSRGYQQTQRRANIQAESRAVLHFMARDLSTRLPGTRWLRKDGDGVPGDPGHDQLAYFRVLDSAERKLDKDGGDVSLAVYQVRFTADRNGVVSPKLYRRLEPSGASQEMLLQGKALAEMPAVDPARDEVVAFNVVSFRARLLKRGADGKWVEWKDGDSGEPVAIDLELGLVDDNTAGRLRSEQDWKGQTPIGAREVGQAGVPVSGEAVRRHEWTIALDRR